MSIHFKKILETGFRCLGENIALDAIESAV